MIAIASSSASTDSPGERRGPPHASIASQNAPAPRPSSTRPPLSRSSDAADLASTRRVAQRQVRDVGEEADALGPAGEVGEQRPRVEEAALVRVVLDADEVEPEAVGEQDLLDHARPGRRPRAPGRRRRAACMTPGAESPSTPGAQPVLAGLDLPDRRLGLDPVDQRAGGVERLAAVGRGGGDDHARLAQRHRARAVLERDRAAPVGRRDLLADRPQPLLGHLGVGLVVELRDLARDALEQHDRARRRVADRRGERDRSSGSPVTRTERTTPAPPLTAAPARPRRPRARARSSAYSRLIATTHERGATSIAASRSETTAPSGSSTSTRSRPARSRRPAKSRTVTTTWTA